eukprot:3973985-Amphidinium_carterae.1
MMMMLMLMLMLMTMTMTMMMMMMMMMVMMILNDCTTVVVNRPIAFGFGGGGAAAHHAIESSCNNSNHKASNSLCTIDFDKNSQCTHCLPIRAQVPKIK